MKIISLTLVLLVGMVYLLDAQTIAKKFQTIPAKGLESIAGIQPKNDPASGVQLQFEQELLMTSSSVVVEIQATCPNFPRNVLRNLLQKGFFDLDFAINAGQLSLQGEFPENNIRYQDQDYHVLLSYKIFVPEHMADIAAR